MTRERETLKFSKDNFLAAKLIIEAPSFNGSQEPNLGRSSLKVIDLSGRPAEINHEQVLLDWASSEEIGLTEFGPAPVREIRGRSLPARRAVQLCYEHTTTTGQTYYTHVRIEELRGYRPKDPIFHYLLISECLDKPISPGQHYQDYDTRSSVLAGRNDIWFEDPMHYHQIALDALRAITWGPALRELVGSDLLWSLE